jgi:hypothetical protein
MDIRAAMARAVDQPLSIETVQLEGPKEGEVLIEIKATGVCHTDKFTLSGADPEGIFPSILGHEGAGIVVDVGAGVLQLFQKPTSCFWQCAATVGGKQFCYSTKKESFAEAQDVAKFGCCLPGCLRLHPRLYAFGAGSAGSGFPLAARSALDCKSHVADVWLTVSQLVPRASAASSNALLAMDFEPGGDTRLRNGRLGGKIVSESVMG